MSDSKHTAEPLSPVKQALLEIRRLRGLLSQRTPLDPEPIAIIGMAVRFPGGAVSPEALWDLLAAGQHGISSTPAERWDSSAVFAADADAPGKTYSRQGGFLADADRFDADFFGITPREAESMDPQHRILLELTWEALEDALIAPTELAGTPAGVFIGLSNSDYGRMLMEDPQDIDAYSSFGVAASIGAGRISYLLDARGPSLVVDTACSSSLTAVHLACASLRASECNLAIVGGANLILSPEATISLSHARMLSRDGQCKTFDADADGYVRAEGCAVIVLKRLRDASAAGDRVLATIRGTAINHDGRSAGLTAPNGPAQEAVIRAALRDARLAPADIDYVEAHGTGTPLGDPIEVQALAAAYGKDRPADQPLLLGSIKTNIGHLEATAGLAGLAKLVLSFKHEALPAHRNFNLANPHVAWDGLPVSIVTTRRPWPKAERPRRAGVSAFGFAGTNVHLVLEEAPRVPAAPGRLGGNRDSLLVLSARSAPALRMLVAQYADWLRGTSQPLADICYSAAVGRSHHAHRFAVVARDRPDLVGKLDAWPTPDSADTPPAILGGPRISFFCPAAVPSAADYTAALRSESPAFSAALEELATAGSAGVSETLSLQFALSRFWMSMGIVPVSVTSAGDANAAELSELLRLRPAADAEADLVLILGADAAAASHIRAVPQVTLGPSPDTAWAGVLDALRTLYLAGAPCGWTAFYRGQDARKVSLPSYPFQRQRFWRPRAASAVKQPRLADWPELIANLALQSANGPLGWNVASYPERWAMLDDLTAGHAINSLVALGEFAQAGAEVSLDDLLRRHAILPRYRNLVARWLHLLDRKGVIGEVAEDVFVAKAALQWCDLTDVWRQVERLLADDPDILAYTRRTSRKLLDLLTGRVSPLEVLFAGGSFDTAEGVYGRSPAARYLNGLVSAAVRAVLPASDTPFRLVEVGAGTGGTTSALADLIPSNGEYWFTDVSDAFLARARRTYGRRPAFRFSRFDLDRPPPAELPVGQTDVVVAANVVHATRDIGDALDRMRSLLRPGGLLILIETTTHHCIFDLTIAFVEGWSSFADTYRTKHPLLRPDRWVAILKERGFVEADRFPAHGSPTDDIGQHVVIARNDVVAPTGVIAPHTHISAPLAGTHDATPIPVDVPALQSDSIQRFDQPPRRERLEEFVRGCAARVMHLDTDGRPGPRERFSDLGMDSLMALQLKTEIGAGLGLGDSLPATIAFDTGTVEALTNQLLTLLAPTSPVQAPARDAAATAPGLLSAADVAAASEAEIETLLAQRVRASRHEVEL